MGRIVFFNILLFCFTNVAIGQQLSPADQRKRSAISENIELHPVQSTLLDSLFTSYGRTLHSVDLRIDEIESDTSMTEDQVLLRINILNQEKKDIREMRELDIKSILRPDQVIIYDEKVAPSKPQVLHFGIHNRADCKVCTQ